VDLLWYAMRVDTGTSVLCGLDVWRTQRGEPVGQYNERGVFVLRTFFLMGLRACGCGVWVWGGILVAVLIATDLHTCARVWCV